MLQRMVHHPDEIRMREHDSLGRSRRAGRVNQSREIGGDRSSLGFEFGLVAVIPKPFTAAIPEFSPELCAFYLVVGIDTNEA
jgi:hypothetical protein